MDLSCGECNVISLYVLCFSVNVCLVCCVSDSVCELFVEPNRNIFGCGCYFVLECYGSVVDVPSMGLLICLDLFVFVYVGSDLVI